MEEISKARLFYEQFIKEFSPSEREYFFRKLKESVREKGYPRCEDLYYYVYFLTVKRRMEGLTGGVKDGLSCYLLCHSMREISDVVNYYRERLEKRKALRDALSCFPGMLTKD